jgi:8-oxo-dGTP pyrophosphatase MutT (NUDIX family)
MRVSALKKCLVNGAALRGGPLPLISAASQRSVDRKAARGARRAAVLVPFAEVDGNLSCIFNVRSASVSTHKSQVSFPGGHVEAGETAADAAFREASEEFGPGFRSGFERVDACRDVLAVTGTVVTAVVAVREKPLTLDAVDFEVAEVASVFALPVAHLLDDANREVRSYEERGGRPAIEMPVFHGGPEPVWGLTAFILDGVLENLVRPCVERPPGASSD